MSNSNEDRKPSARGSDTGGDGIECSLLEENEDEGAAALGSGVGGVNGVSHSPSPTVVENDRIVCRESRGCACEVDTDVEEGRKKSAVDSTKQVESAERDTARSNDNKADHSRFETGHEEDNNTERVNASNQATLIRQNAPNESRAARAARKLKQARERASRRREVSTAQIEAERGELDENADTKHLHSENASVAQTLDIKALAGPMRGDGSRISNIRPHISLQQDDETSEPSTLQCSPLQTPTVFSNGRSHTDGQPGAYQSPGRAPGRLPAWGRRLTMTIRSSIAHSPRQSVGSVESQSIVPAAELVEDMENNIRNQILANSAEAEVINPEGVHRFGASCCKLEEGIHKKAIFWLALSVIALAGTLALSLGLTKGRGSNAQTTVARVSVLDTVMNRDILICDNATSFLNGHGLGFVSQDLCHAIAAAIFGDQTRVKYINLSTADRFIALARGEVDVLTAPITHTFERDIHEATAKIGFSFSTPYLYGGLSFGGIPPYPWCIDELDTTGACADLSVCVLANSTWLDIAKDHIPSSHIVVYSQLSEMYKMLENRTCNAIAGERTIISETNVKENGYSGPYILGRRTYSKEPLAVVTQKNDPLSELVDNVIQALLVAEELNITQSTVSAFLETQHEFGKEFEGIFRNSITAVGNYGEIYERHLQAVLPRERINEINVGGSGLIYSHPFGKLTNNGPGPVGGGTLEKIKKRGWLHCGIVYEEGLDVSDAHGKDRHGLDYDFCHSVAASVTQQMNSVKSVSFDDAHDGFEALADGSIDVLSGASCAILREMEGFSFSQPYFYDRVGTSRETRSLATRQEDQQWASFVYWIVASTFYAEESGISQDTSNNMPQVRLFGSDYNRMFRDALLAVGNYGEVFARNMNSTRIGKNRLNLDPFGPQHLPLPYS